MSTVLENTKNKTEDIKNIMLQNIDLALDREQKIDMIQASSDELLATSHGWKRKTKISRDVMITRVIVLIVLLFLILLIIVSAVIGIIYAFTYKYYK